MKLKLTLLSFCLLGIGMFSHAQQKTEGAPKVKFKAPATPEKQYDKDGNLLPPPPAPPKVEVVKFKAPKGAPRDKEGNLLPPPPPPPIDRDAVKKSRAPKGEKVRFAPPKIVKNKPADPNTPPPADDRS